jgi:signal transduction histidine kinase
MKSQLAIAGDHVRGRLQANSVYLTDRHRPRTLPRGVLPSVLGSIIILCVLEVASVRLINSAATSVALDEVGKFGSESVLLALAPHLSDDLLALDTSARRAINSAGEALVAEDQIVHIKIWSDAGTVVWSDEESLVGRTFEMEEAERALFGSQGHIVEVSSLGKVENQLEVTAGVDRLLEVYVGTRTLTGTPVVLEIYAPYSRVTERAAELRRKFLPLMSVVLIVLAVAQLSLVLLLGRRLARSERRHTTLLERLIQSSDAERRRVAAEVHDGVVQDLIGMSFGLSALAATTPEREEPLTEMATSTRSAVASLRSLLGSIYPVEVPPEGWVAGIADLVDALGQLGVTVHIDAAPTQLTATEELLVLRVAREALRNVAAHANATEVAIRLTERRSRLRLTIHDNGCGFEPSARKEGHIGLRLIHDVIRDAGGEMTIESAPTDGTTLQVELEMAQ